MNRFLQYLLDSDYEQLRSYAQTARYRAGEILLKAGDVLQSIFIVESGRLRVDRSAAGLPLTVAHLGAGEVFGEMSFIEQRPASASVIAEEDCEVLVLGHDALQNLLTMVPGFNTRLYQSLAVILSGRLRALGDLAARSAIEDMLRVNRFHATRVGHMTEQQMPSPLVADMEAWHAAMWATRTAIRKRDIDAATAREKMFAVADGVCDLLERYTADAELTESALSDPMAFRGQEDMAAGIGGYVFRETFPLFMMSTTMARCYMKPLGYPDDHVTMQHIQDERTAGESLVGEMVDAWFLQRPLCRSRRASRNHVAGWLGERVRDRPSTAITGLACGCAGEFLKLPATVRITLVDLNEQAMVAAAQRARDAGQDAHLTFIQANVLGAPLAIPPQAVVSALGVCEYLEDAQVLDLLNRMWDLLAPGGSALVTQLHPVNPDRLLMEHILDWKVFHRTEEEFRGIAARSRFGGAWQASRDETGVTLFLTAEK